MGAVSKSLIIVDKREGGIKNYLKFVDMIDGRPLIKPFGLLRGSELFTPQHFGDILPVAAPLMKGDVHLQATKLC